MADLFVSYQLKDAVLGHGFGCITIGGMGEPTTMAAVEKLRLFVQADCESRGNMDPNVVILWWKELGHD